MTTNHHGQEDLNSHQDALATHRRIPCVIRRLCPGPRRTRARRWATRMGLALLLGGLVAGCGQAKVEKRTRSITASGITYILPVEKEIHTENLQGFSYKGESVAVSESGLQLIVDDREYGAVKTADRVSLLEKGKVYVNGVERKPL